MAELSATMTAWEHSLAPWIYALECARLHHIERMFHNTRGPRECWWGVDALLLPPTTEMWTLLREAIELLDLLARVEPQTTRMLFAAIAGFSDPAATRQPPRFQIKVDCEWDEMDPAMQQGIRHLLTHDGRAPSETYTSVKASLLDQWASAHDGRALDREVDGRVELAFEFTVDLGDDGEEPELLAALRTLALAHKRNISSTPRRTRDRHALALHSLQIRLVRADGTPMTDAALQQFNDIAAAGVPITHVYMVSLFGAQLDRALLGKFMLDQFLPRDCRGVRDLEISACDFDSLAVEALCTAIARSTSLDNVCFEVADMVDDGGGVQIAGWWRWLAYALFSRHTDHTIYSAQLNLSSLTMSHIRTIREMLHHDNPLSLLYQIPTTGETQVDLAALGEAATVRLGHHDDAVTTRQDHEGPVVQVSERTPRCQIVRNRPGEDVVEIIVPGTGVCWVDRSDVVDVKSLVVRDSHPIRELTINEGVFTGESAQPIIEFLQLVGSPLERLEVFNGDLVGDAFGHTIVEACPNLKHLRLKNLRVESLDWLVSVPATCKLHALYLDLGKSVVQWSESWLRLFTALSDASHPLTLSLRHLQIDLRRINDDDAQVQAEQDAICEHLVAMLAKNSLLQHCSVLSCSDETSATYKTHFMAHQNEPLSEEERPLPSPQKLAFLSVVSPAVQVPPSPRKQQKKTPDSTAVNTPVPAQTTLTPEAIDKVFAFAATPKRRVCHFSSRYVDLAQDIFGD